MPWVGKTLSQLTAAISHMMQAAKIGTKSLATNQKHNLHHIDD